MRKKAKRVLLLMSVCFLSMPGIVIAQQQTEAKITLQVNDMSLGDVIKLLRQKTGKDFVFSNQEENIKKSVTVNLIDRPLSESLIAVFGDGFQFEILPKMVIVRPVSEQTSSASPTVKKPVTGTVRDELGDVLIGVNVFIEGTSNGTTTDVNGQFALETVGTNAITFSYLGYQKVVIPVREGATINVALKEATAELGEVVVISTGYQTIRKEKMTGSAIAITDEDFQNRYTPNIVDNLEGRVAGLVNYGGNLTVRGVSSLYASTSPLFVVDGLPFEGSPAQLNPYDIESITVLKDAAATAIYGARASNGIIVISTKQAKERRSVIEASANFTIYQKPDYSKYNYMTAAQQVDVESDFYDYYFNGGVVVNPIQTITNYIENGTSINPIQHLYYQKAQGNITQAQLDAQLNEYRQNDFASQYKDNALKNRFLQQYNVAIRSRGDSYSSSLVVTLKSDNAGMIYSKDQEINVFYKGKYELAKILEFNFGVNTVIGQSKSPNSFATSPFNVSPYMQLLDGSGNRLYYTNSNYNMYNSFADSEAELESMWVNHLDELAFSTSKNASQNWRYYANLNVKLLPGLTFNPQFQYEGGQSKTSTYSDAESFTVRYLKNIYTLRSGTAGSYTYNHLFPENGGMLSTTDLDSDSWTLRGQMNYSRIFNEKHVVDIIAGTEFRQTGVKGNHGLLLGYDEQLQSHSTSSVDFGQMGLITSTTYFKPGLNPQGTFSTYISSALDLILEETHRFNSGYANFTYTYDGKYNAFASYRKDYADVFGLDKKYRGKPLWSIGTGWNLHKESFLQNYDWINFLKFRASYGVTGNMYLGATSYLTANSGYINAATKLPVSVVRSAGNDELRWEKNAIFNVGLDYTLFDNRLNGSLEWYRKKGTDIFATTRIDPSEGFTSQIINNGNLINTGIDASLRVSWLKRGAVRDFDWTSSFTYSSNKNEITYVDEVAVTPLALVQGGFKVGYPVNSLFSFQYKGLNDKGQPQWLKADGSLTAITLDGTDMDAIVYSGSAYPTFNWGFINELRYKGVGLTIHAVYYGGHYLRAQQPSVYSGVPYGPLPSYLSDSWTPTNTDTNIPGFGRYAPSSVPSNHLEYSDAFVHPGDFIKIRNVVLDYNLPEKLISKLKMKTAALHFQITNPKALWIKNKVNVDPETGGAPLLTAYVLGINFTF